MAEGVATSAIMAVRCIGKQVAEYDIIAWEPNTQSKYSRQFLARSVVAINQTSEQE